MDMNASYNRLVEEYLPHAAIVYDRYHMQAQYGKRFWVPSDSKKLHDTKNLPMRLNHRLLKIWTKLR